MKVPRVFFMDRLSRSSLSLAAAAAERGAVVVFEPSSKSDKRLLTEVLQLAHIVKYSDQRLAGLDEFVGSSGSVLLEIQTLGSDGLRFRSQLPKSPVPEWEHLSALAAPVLVDTCGAGDWCTAGIVSKIAVEGSDGLKRVSGSQLHHALRFGQALASWNCGFEGARGGMYQLTAAVFEREVNRILGGDAEPSIRHASVPKQAVADAVACPGCPQAADV